MYSFPIKYAPSGWEEEDSAEMDLDRLYGGTLEPGVEPIRRTDGNTLKPERLSQLVGIPTFLMYMGGTSGGNVCSWRTAATSHSVFAQIRPA